MSDKIKSRREESSAVSKGRPAPYYQRASRGGEPRNFTSAGASVDAESTSGRLTSERMAQLRRQSKLRQRLALEVEDLNEQLQVAYADFEVLREEDVKITRQIITYDERQNLRRQVQSDIAAKGDEIARLREQLVTATQELNDYDDTTQIR